MDRNYEVYKLTSPSGKYYIGLTRQGVHKRWLCHIKRAKTSINHPLYNSLRKNGHESFLVEVLEAGLTEKEAVGREKFHIALSPIELRLNISDGGETNGAFGAKTFWNRMQANPVEKAEYLKKLSDVKLATDWSDYKDMSNKAQQWRRLNPKKAYKLAMRGVRIANRSRPLRPKKERTLKDRLLWRHRRDLATQRMVTEVWAKRTDAEKKVIFDKIGAKASERNAKKDPSVRKAEMVRAREGIDRKKQGAAASIGIKQFWADLKKDPIKYSEYIEARRKTLKQTNDRKKNENL